MKKIQITKAISLILSMIGVVVFWIAGFADKMMISRYAFLAAGIFAWIAVIAKVILDTKSRHYSY